MEVLMRLRRCEPRLEIDVAAAAAAAAGWWTQYRSVWQAKAMVLLPEQGINSRFIKTGIQLYGVVALLCDSNSKKRNSLEIQAKQGLFLGYFRKLDQGQRITYKKVSVKFPYS